MEGKLPPEAIDALIEDQKSAVEFHKIFQLWELFLRVASTGSEKALDRPALSQLFKGFMEDFRIFTDTYHDVFPKDLPLGEVSPE